MNIGNVALVICILRPRMDILVAVPLIILKFCAMVELRP